MIEKFREAYPDERHDRIWTGHEGDPDHYQLDLWEANRLNLLEAGLLEDHMAVTNLCTCCNPDLIFSHRATGGKRGVTVGMIEMF